MEGRLRLALRKLEYSVVIKRTEEWRIGMRKGFRNNFQEDLQRGYLQIMMHIINLLGTWKQTLKQLTSRQIFLVRTPFMGTRHLTLTANMDKRHLTLTANRVLFFCLCVFLKLYFLLLWVKKSYWPNPLPYYYRYAIFIKRIIRWSM